MSSTISSATRMAKSIVAKHIKMLKEADNEDSETMSVASGSSCSSNSGLSKYHKYVSCETAKIKEELKNNKDKLSGMEIRKMAIDRWKKEKNSIKI
jgi:hypothetical protein